MKRYGAPLILLSSLFILMGMGNVAGVPSVEKIPTPDKNFHASVTDRQGVQTSLTQFSYDGRVFIEGKRGEGLAAIPFERISQVQFGKPQGNEIPAEVSLKDGKRFQVRLEKGSKFYGKADFGTFQIDAKDLKSLSFHP